MPTAVATAYPEFLEQIREFVQQHRMLKQQRLRLAVYFAPRRKAKRDIFLFELIDDFGGDAVESTGSFFEFSYGSTPALPLPPGVSLRMMLTNPNELEIAIRDRWKGVEELRAASHMGRARVIYADSKGRRLWDLINDAA
jgi:hypothetical protein